MFNSNELIKVAHLQNLTNQPMLNGALLVEMVSSSFSKSKRNFEKNKDMGSEKYISTRFR